jgi:hypothetical protein
MIRTRTLFLTDLETEKAEISHSTHKKPFPPAAENWPLKIWIGYAAVCSCLGWILSAAGKLNALSYSIAAVVSLLVLVVLAARFKPPLPRLHLRRFLQPLPFIYLLLLAGSVIGGLLYAPNNYDMLTYRIPRILNWLVEARWHWISGYIDRMNYSGTGWEWMVLPLLLLTHKTSLFFLINIVSYLLLPGLFFSFLRNLGVTGRMAWAWMWLLPAGLNFAMQAGGGSNDTVSAVFLLAAINLAFSARRSGRSGEVFWSIIAAALLTGCKASNLPLALPCGVALLPALALLKRQLPAAAVVLCIAVLSSQIPTLILNHKYTGDWAGFPEDEARLKMHNPVAGILGNTLQLAVANLQPPVMPIAGKWNKISPRLLPRAIDQLLQRDFPRFTLHMNELPQEEQSGVGLGLTAMAILSLLAVRFRKQNDIARPRFGDPWRGPIIVAGLLALLAVMAMLGSEAIARLAAPYYPFGIAAVLSHSGNYALARKKWWRVCAILVGLSVIPALILTPSRPLFPAVRLTWALAEHHPNSEAIQRAALVYQVYADRAENLAPLRKYLPADQKVIGILGDDDTSETAMWEPFFSRQVVELGPQDDYESARAKGIQYIVVGNHGLESYLLSLDQFLARYQGTVIAHEPITIKVAEGPQDWLVVKIRSAARPAGPGVSTLRLRNALSFNAPS